MLKLFQLLSITLTTPFYGFWFVAANDFLNLHSPDSDFMSNTLRSLLRLIWHWEKFFDGLKWCMSIQFQDWTKVPLPVPPPEDTTLSSSLTLIWGMPTGPGGVRLRPHYSSCDGGHELRGKAVEWGGPVEPLPSASVVARARRTGEQGFRSLSMERRRGHYQLT